MHVSMVDLHSVDVLYFLLLLRHCAKNFSECFVCMEYTSSRRFTVSCCQQNYPSSALLKIVVAAYKNLN